MARLRTRAVGLVGVVALLPLVILGALASSRAKNALLEEAELSNSDLARRAAAEIEGHVTKYDEMVRQLALVLAPSARLTLPQMSRVLRGYRSEVPDLRQLDLVGADGKEVATGRLDEPLRDRAKERAVEVALGGQSFVSPVRIADDLVPEVVIAAPQKEGGKTVGALVATIDITEMWRVIDGIKVGTTGYARVVGHDGTLLAIGRNDLKQRVFTHEKDRSVDLAASVLAGTDTLKTTYLGADREELLAVGQPIPKLHWGLIIEQPLAEALAPHRRFQSILIVISLALLAAAALAGFFGARSIVEPIERLRLRAAEIARGLLDARIDIEGPEELHALGEGMNAMCADLIRLQDDVRKRERIATMGRLAAGLAHDLKHPIRALQSIAKRVEERGDDERVRKQFGEAATREFKRLEGFLDDLKRVSRDEPIEFRREPLDAANLVADYARDLESAGKPSGVELVVTTRPAPILASKDLLGRVLSNLGSNAFEAMEGEGVLTLDVAERDGSAEIRVGDSGCGISPERVAGLFADFETTKRRGLGLGLAVCKKIVGDHGGSIAVESVVGKGTTFIIRLPRRVEAAA